MNTANSMKKDLIRFPIYFLNKDLETVVLERWADIFQTLKIQNTENLLIEEYGQDTMYSEIKDYNGITKSIILANSYNLFRVKQCIQEFERVNSSTPISILTSEIVKYLLNEKNIPVSTTFFNEVMKEVKQRFYYQLIVIK